VTGDTGWTATDESCVTKECTATVAAATATPAAAAAAAEAASTRDDAGSVVAYCVHWRSFMFDVCRAT